MNKQITIANGVQNTDFVTTTSRYINSRIIYWGDENILTFTTYKRKKHKFSNDDKYMVIPAGCEYRPDLIAKKAYGIDLISYWWKIMEVNNIFDVMDLKAGRVIRIPTTI